MVNKNTKEDGLEMLFAEARAEDTRQPSDDLMARVLADAQQMQSDMAAPAISAQTMSVEAASGFGAIVSAVGGWFGASGVVAAGVTGLVMGFALPDQVDVMLNGQVSTIIGDDAASLLPGFDGLLAMAE